MKEEKGDRSLVYLRMVEVFFGGEVCSDFFVSLPRSGFVDDAPQGIEFYIGETLGKRVGFVVQKW